MARDLQNGSTSATFAFATIFLLASLALVAVAFATNHWQEMYVDREALRRLGVSEEVMRQSFYYNRFRGLFRTCYPEDAGFLDMEDNLVDGRCLTERGYEIPTRRQDTLEYGGDYEIRIHLMRAWFACLVVAMVFLFVACFTGVLGCWNTSSKMMRSTGTVVFIGMFFAAGAMAVFHGVYYLDERELDMVPGTLAFIEEEAKSNTDFARLSEATVSLFGYSYIVGWVAVGCAAISGVLYLIVGYKFHDRRERTYGSKSHRNRAYDYMDKHGYPADYPPVGHPADVVYVDPPPGELYSGYRY